MMLPIYWDKINSFMDSNDLFNRAARSMRNYLRNYFQDDEESFLEDFRADWETVRNAYRFENAGISFSRDFWRELDYISVWIRIYDAEDSYIGEYNLFFDEEWQGLLSALRDTGAISSDEYIVASNYGKVIPIGYDDENGVFHPYANTVNVFVDGKGNVPHYPFDENAPRIDDLASWFEGYNDPLKYLDDWIENYREWHDYMAEQTNDDGTPKYGRLDLIQNDINSASNVARVIRELMEEI